MYFSRTVKEWDRTRKWRRIIIEKASQAVHNNVCLCVELTFVLCHCCHDNDLNSFVATSTIMAIVVIIIVIVIGIISVVIGIVVILSFLSSFFFVIIAVVVNVVVIVSGVVVVVVIVEFVYGCLFVSDHGNSHSNNGHHCCFCYIR